jgi:hypothetical protein
MRRAEFPARVKEVLAGRAGYRCSFPGCARITIGPGALSDDVASTGVASHIYSAANHGPRGTGGFSSIKRSEIENGVWLCAEHARLIDLNRGDLYSPGTLRRYKYLHEARVAMAQGHRPFGVVEELLVFRSRVFVDDTILRLSKVMLIVGDNATGKIFIFRLLNSLSQEFRSQLGSLFTKDENLSYSIRLRNPEPHQVTVEGIGAQITALLDGIVVPFIPLTVDIFFQEQRTRFRPLEAFLKHKRSEFQGDFDPLDDLLLLSEYWQMEPELVRKLVAKAGTFVEHAFDNPRFVEDKGVNRLLVNDKRWRPDAPIHKISGGMLEMLSLDVAIAHALLMSEHLPTMMLLNAPLLHLDYGHMGLYVDFLLSNEVKFQTLIATPEPRWAIPDLPWEIVHLRKVGGKCVLEQLN